MAMVFPRRPRLGRRLASPRAASPAAADSFSFGSVKSWSCITFEIYETNETNATAFRSLRNAPRVSSHGPSCCPRVARKDEIGRDEAGTRWDDWLRQPRVIVRSRDGCLGLCGAFNQFDSRALPLSLATPQVAAARGAGEAEALLIPFLVRGEVFVLRSASRRDLRAISDAVAHDPGQVDRASRPPRASPR